MSKNTTDELKTFIGEKIGEATMQWEPIPSGVFKSEKAVKILDEIYEAVEQLISNREKLAYRSGYAAVCDLCKKPIEGGLYDE